MESNFLIYGSYGFTGNLVAQEAVKRGLRPVLGGRNARKLARQAGKLGLKQCAFSLEDGAAIDAALEGVAAVVHCAGPFSYTSRPVADSCLRTGTHYLDITGEIPVYEALAARDGEAKAGGVMLLPGVGFDVVPTDCLAAHLKRLMPTATRLALAFRAVGRPSRGTARTSLENVHRGGMVRRGGVLTHVPAGWKERRVDFGRGPVRVASIPWGDVFMAYYSTGIPNIEAYIAIPGALRRLLVLSNSLRWLLRSTPVQLLFKSLVRFWPEGPGDELRQRGLSLIWGEVVDNAGNRKVSRLRTPEAYRLTALTALAAAQKVLAGQAPPGFQTPSLAYGPDFILEIEGVTREDLE